MSCSLAVTLSPLENFVINQCEISLFFFILSDLATLLTTHKEYPFSQTGGGEPEQLPIKPSQLV